MLLFTINLLNCMMPPSQLSSCDFYQDPPRTASELKIQSFSRIVTSSQPQEIDKIRPPHCPRITKSSSPLLSLVPYYRSFTHSTITHSLSGRQSLHSGPSFFVYIPHTNLYTPEASGSSYYLHHNDMLNY